MHAWWVFFRKELRVESRYSMPLIQNLLIGPMVSALPLFLIYRKMFANPQTVVSGWSGQNYKAEIWVGVVCHFCLNSGTYVLFNRLVTEWIQNTYALLWLSPRPRLISLMTLSLNDVFRVVLFSLGMSLLFLYHRVTVLVFLVIFAHFIGIFLFGSALGAIRFFHRQQFPASLDFVNFFCLGLIFTSGFYFPVGVLPSFLPLLAKFNPLFYGKVALLSLIRGEFSVLGCFFFWSAVVSAWGLVFLCLAVNEAELTEKCVKN